MALYALDWQNGSPGRSETVSIFDGSASGDGSGPPLDTQPLALFQAGDYLVWKVRGHVRIVVTNTGNNANAVLSGIFFDGAS